MLNTTWLTKIAKKNLELPFAIPEQAKEKSGTEEIGSVMSEETSECIQQAYPGIQYLGAGKWGIVGEYEKDGRVRAIKITREKEEIEIANYIIKTNPPCIVHIFKADPKPLQTKPKPLWIIEQEKIQTLEKGSPERTALTHISNEAKSDLDKIVRLSIDIIKEQPELTDIINEYVEMIKCIRKYNIKVSDPHGGNVGYNNENKLVLFDIGLAKKI